MAKITRKIAKIFGQNAGFQQIGQFGSLAASAVAYTTDPTVIQALSNYLTGWFGAIVGSNSPAIEDMNAICYLFAYQIAYIMQAGIPEYDGTTTYYTGSLVSSNGTIYRSIQDSNIGHVVADGTWWSAPGTPGVLTPNTIPYLLTYTVDTNSTLTWPNLTIPSGHTVTVPATSYLIGISSIVNTGTLIISGTCRII